MKYVETLKKKIEVFCGIFLPSFGWFTVGQSIIFTPSIDQWPTKT